MQNSEPTRNLMTAIRKGLLAPVIQALDAGAAAEAPDAHGNPGLPLRIASFHGYNSIVKELLKRGANAQGHAGKNDDNAPIMAAIRGGNTATIQLLLEYGAELPAGYEFSSFATNSAIAGKCAAYAKHPEQDLEEIQIEACFGVNTQILDQELMRQAEREKAATADAALEPLKIGSNSGNPGKLKRWLSF